MTPGRSLTLLEALPAPLERSLGVVRGRLEALQRVVVAYSGGVDSALVAALAMERLGPEALAITGISPALAPHLRQEARDQAAWLGVRHQELPTAELADPAYASNPDDRCYACKRELHGLLAPIAAAAGGARVVDGVNLDDLGYHRPGLRAARVDRIERRRHLVGGDDLLEPARVVDLLHPGAAEAGLDDVRRRPLAARQERCGDGGGDERRCDARATHGLTPISVAGSPPAMLKKTR